jgi:hypothetical protein
MDLTAPLSRTVVYLVAGAYLLTGILLFALTYASRIGVEWFPVATTVVIFAAMVAGRVDKPQVLVENLLAYATVGAGVVGGYLTELSQGGFAVVAVSAACFAFLETRDDTWFSARVTPVSARLVAVLVAGALGVLIFVALCVSVITQTVTSRG